MLQKSNTLDIEKPGNWKEAVLDRKQEEMGRWAGNLNGTNLHLK